MPNVYVHGKAIDVRPDADGTWVTVTYESERAQWHGAPQVEQALADVLVDTDIAQEPHEGDTVEVRGPLKARLTEKTVDYYIEAKSFDILEDAKAA